MNRSLLAAIMPIALALFVGCGPKPGGKTADDEKAGQGEVAPGGEDASGDEKAETTPCQTSDDCAEGQICIDDECAIPVPDGFY